MRAGKLRHLVTIQNFSQTQNQYGEVITEWIDGPRIRASVEPLRGREYFAAAQVNAETTYRVRCRYHPELATDDATSKRLTVQGMTLEIEAVLDVELKHEWMEIICHTD